MPKSKKLQKQIANKLEKLERLLTKIDEAHAINSDDPET
jgi:restriction endonuclease S subunit